RGSARHDDSNVSQSAFRAFIRAYGLFRGCMRPYFAQFGISGAQWGVLRQLHRAHLEGRIGMRLNELGRGLLVRPPSITGLIERLERLGFVTKKAASDDQRAKLVTLTTAGKQLVARISRHHPQQIRTVLAGLSIKEQRELNRLMEKFVAHM